MNRQSLSLHPARWLPFVLISTIAMIGAAGSADADGDAEARKREAREQRARRRARRKARRKARRQKAQRLGRALGNHVIYAPEYSDPSTLTTHFGFEQGLALLNIPDVEVPGATSPQDLQLTGVVESIDVGLRLTERLALEGRFEGQAVVGSNPQSAYHLGGSFGSAWEAGVGFRLFRDEPNHMQVVARAGARFTDGRRIQPAAVVERLLQDPEGSAATVSSGRLASLLVQHDSGQMAAASISAAKGFADRFVFQTSVEGRSGVANVEITGRDREIQAGLTRHRLSAGAAFSAHARPIFPLALQLEYRLGYLLQFPDGDVPIEEVIPQNTVSTGLFLAGWPDLTLGVRASTLLRRERRQNRRFWFGQFVMRYFFDGA